MDEHAALIEQKEQCVFCKIVKGDVPAKKVFEDDKVLAIMDINPAKKGHVLILPKEHYPILPLIPFAEMQHVFRRAQGIIKAVKEATLSQGVTLFIANGGAAGQQSPHFIMHAIPREKDDFFMGAMLPSTGDKAVNDSFEAPLRQRLSAMMQAYLSQTGRVSFINEQERTSIPLTPEMENHSVSDPSDEQLDRLIALIDKNEDLKDALLFRVDEVKEAIRTNDRWREIFAGVDVDKLSQNLRFMAAAQAKRTHEEDEA